MVDNLKEVRTIQDDGYPKLDEKYLALSSEARKAGIVFNRVRSSIMEYDRINKSLSPGQEHPIKDYEIVMYAGTNHHTKGQIFEKIVIHYDQGERDYYFNVLKVIKSMVGDLSRHAMIPRFLGEFIVKEEKKERP